jgi:MFS family permease
VKEETRKYIRLLAVVSTMGLSMVLALVIGILIGYFLDKWLKTGPVFFLIFMILGIVARFSKHLCDHEKDGKGPEMIPAREGGQKGGDEERLLKTVRLMNGVVFAALLLFGALCMSPFFTFGVAMGGLIILANFHLLHRILKKAFHPQRLAAPKTVIAKYYLRLLATGIILYLLIVHKLADPLGLVVGLSVVVINLLLLALNEVRKMFLKEAN